MAQKPWDLDKHRSKSAAVEMKYLLRIVKITREEEWALREEVKEKKTLLEGIEENQKGRLNRRKEGYQVT